MIRYSQSTSRSSKTGARRGREGGRGRKTSEHVDEQEVQKSRNSCAEADTNKQLNCSCKLEDVAARSHEEQIHILYHYCVITVFEVQNGTMLEDAGSQLKLRLTIPGRIPRGNRLSSIHHPHLSRHPETT